jgi:hypothetical protein
MKGILYIQRDENGDYIKNPEGLEGNLTYAYHNASLLDGDEYVIAMMGHAKIDDITVAGIHLSGSQGDLRGRLTFQQWWFRTG